MKINCWKAIKFRVKMYNMLPKYHPETGERLFWDIFIYRKNVKGYDMNTGKHIGGFYTMEITHEARRTSGSEYMYDWHKKKIIETANFNC